MSLGPVLSRPVPGPSQDFPGRDSPVAITSGYLGLLLGESLFSYLITASKWFKSLRRKLNEHCRKADEELEPSTA